jgi:dCTP deaminase
MILTGTEIQHAVKWGEITIDPFNKEQVNPNSYNFRLLSTILKVSINENNESSFEKIELDKNGYVLLPNVLYLAATSEIIGSKNYVMTLLGKSSLGRLGLFLNTTADLGHFGSVSQWTLELSVVQPLRIYPNMEIGQIAFWTQQGNIAGYKGKYLKDLGPTPSKEDFANYDINR